MNVIRLHCEARPFLETLERVNREIARAFAIPPDLLRLAEWRDWRKRLECWRAWLGVRPVTSHVAEGEWLEHWRAGIDPIRALLEEMRD